MPKKPGFNKKKKQSIYVRFDAEIFKRIEEKASMEGRYLGETVERVVSDYFNADSDR